MRHTPAGGRRRDESGFTLIELMVVVLIIAILLAIAVVTFLGARTRANNRVAQQDLRTALTAEATYYTDKQTWSNAAGLGAIESSVTFQDMAAPITAKAALNQVMVDASGPPLVFLATKSNGGACYFIMDNNGVVSFGTDMACATAPLAAKAGAGAWQPSQAQGWTDGNTNS